MKCRLSYIVLVSALMLMSSGAEAQVLSFEDPAALFSWTAKGGKVAVSGMRYKFGTSSLKLDYKSGAEFVLDNPTGLFEASRSKHGGITMWLYDEGSAPSDLQIVFLNSSDKEVCRIPFRLGYRGWRCLWARFVHDMGKNSKDIISKMKLVFPETSGTLYIDMLEFTTRVPWKLMSDAHVTINRTSFGMIPDIVRYRNAVPTGDVIEASETDINLISERFRDWCLGKGDFPKNKYVRMRTSAEKAFISRGLAEAEKLTVEYNDDGTPVGEPLFTLDAPGTVEGKKLRQFRSINEKVLIPLALDYHKNGGQASLDKVKYIYDWFNDQGWADGSSMGTIVLEKLRSAGYIYSFFLMKDLLPQEMKARETAAMNWFTMFGHCYDLNEYCGANSDDLRALANGKLIYALSLDDHQQRCTALTAFKRYMDKAFGIAPGVHDVIKDDYSGYHHRTAYNSGYYPQALYSGAQIAWILDGTPYALDQKTTDNIVRGLKTFHFFCAGLDVPAGTVGRFPEGQKILHELIPAYAYMVLRDGGQDRELLGIFNDVLEKAASDPAWTEYVVGVNSDMSYMTTVGEMEAVAKAASYKCEPQDMAHGALFMPYSGLHVSKDQDIHFNVKGYSRYIWDFEAGTNQNEYGRWISNGHLEFFDFRNGNRSFHPSEELYDWNHIVGITAKVLPLKNLKYDGKTTGHRNYSDQSFLAGVHGAEKVSMFSVRLHDIYADTSFRADKSYFFFEDMVLCLGSGVNSDDSRNSVATTMFQDFRGAGKQKTEGIYEDASFAYVVKEGTVRFNKEGKRGIAYIDHGAAPKNAGYEYYMVKDKSAAASVLSETPVKVLKRDDSAHVVERDGAVCAALFKEGVSFEGMVVEKVNIPLAYILEDKGNRLYRLSLCEPDMRRSWHLNMNDLSDKEVIEEEKPFETSLVLDGDFEVISDNGGDVRTVKENGKTILTLNTVKARNYTVELKKQ